MKYTILLLAAVITLAAYGQQQTAPTAQEKPIDESKWLPLLFAFQGAGGWGAQGSPTAYGGVKLGLSSALMDAGYDRSQFHNGFAVAGSAMLPVLRFPGPQKDLRKNYLRMYAEPGIGYSTTEIHGYLSAKAMFALLSDARIESATRWSPYIEVEHRFPFRSLSSGDTRISFGLMYALCRDCGVE